MSGSKANALILAALLLLSMAVPMFVAYAGGQTTYTGTNVDVTIVNDTLQPGMTYNISIIVTNKMPDTSLEKVIVLTNYTADLLYNIEIISADIYNSTGAKQGQWSYEVRTYEYNGANYTAVNAYTFPGNLALGQGDYVNITIEATVTSTPGVYKMLVLAIHTTSDYTDVVVEETEVYILVDGSAPTIEVLTPLYNGTHYVAHETTDQAGNRVIEFQLSITDTYDGANKVNLSEHPVTLSISAYNDTATFTVNYQEQLVDDYTLLVTGTIVLDSTFQEGGQVTLSVTVTDEAENTITKNIEIVLDNTAPTIDNVAFYKADGTQLYYDGTYYIVGSSDQQITVEVSATDPSGIYKVYVTYDGGEYVEAEEANGVWTATVELPIEDVNTNDTLQLNIVVLDYALNTATASSNILFDLTGPRIYANVTADTVNRFNSGSPIKIEINVTDYESGFDDAASYVTVYSYTNILGTEQASDPANITEWTIQGGNGTVIVELSPGYYYEIEVHAYDNAGNYNSTTYKVLVDNTTPPTIEYSVEGASYCTDTGKYYTNGQVTVTGTVYDVDYIDVTLYVNGSVEGTWSGLEPGSSFTVSINSADYNEGVYNVTIEVADQSGNKDSVTLWIVVDKTAPALDENATDFDDYNDTVFDTRVDGAPEIIMFTDAGSPFPAGEIVVLVDDSDVTGIVNIVTGESNGVYYAEINMSGVESYLANGQHNVTVVVKDCAGNAKTVTFTYYVDEQAPTIEPGPNGVVVEYWVGEIIHLDGTVSDDYGLAKIKIEVSNGTDTLGVIEFPIDGKEFNLSDLGAINLTEYNIILEPNVEYTVVVTVYDELGAEAQAYETYHTSSASDTIQLDKVPPAFTLVYPVEKYFNGVYWDNQIPATVQILITDTGVGVDANTIAVYVNGTPANFTYEATADGIMVYFNLTAEGVFNVSIEAADTLGNANNASYLIGVDVTPPTVEYQATLLRGGAIIADIVFSDNLSGTTDSFILKVVINGSAYSLTIPVEALSGGYYVGILAADPDWQYFKQVYAWEDLVDFIGGGYEYTFTSKELVPFIAIADGKVFLFIQYLPETTNATIKLCIYDYAGNKGGLAINATIEKGAFYPVKLYSGWNLLSAPTVGQFTTEDVANALVAGGEIDMVAVYNPETGSYDIYVPGVSDQPLPLSDGVSFWVHFTGAAEGIVVFQGDIPYDTVAGAPPSPLVYTIPAGGNFVGFTALKALSVNYYLSSLVEAPVYDFIYLFDAENQMWITVPITAYNDIMPGMGMWVYAYDNVALVVPTWYEAYIR